MKNYRGYYIDHIRFNNEAEIDAFIKQQAIEHHQHLAYLFGCNPSIELCIAMGDHADRLVRHFSLSYEEVEAIELAAI